VKRDGWDDVRSLLAIISKLVPRKEEISRDPDITLACSNSKEIGMPRISLSF
jgi:hypothetical protein